MVLIYTKNCQRKLAGMHTHKWLSNSLAVMKEIPIQDRACKLEFNENSSFFNKYS